MKAATSPNPPSKPPTALLLIPALLEDDEAGAAVPLAAGLALLLPDAEADGEPEAEEAEAELHRVSSIAVGPLTLQWSSTKCWTQLESSREKNRRWYRHHQSLGAF
jgi:hypothetical protein